MRIIMLRSFKNKKLTKNRFKAIKNKILNLNKKMIIMIILQIRKNLLKKKIKNQYLNH
jgi:hypothetical protein